MSGLMNGIQFHGIRNATTMPVLGRRRMFDPSEFRDAVDAAREKGLIRVEIEACSRCNQPAVPGRALCLEHGAILTNGRMANAVKLTKHCLQCNAEYITAYKYSIYCSTRCKSRSQSASKKRPEPKPKKEMRCKYKGCKTRFIANSWNHRYCEPCRKLKK